MQPKQVLVLSKPWHSFVFILRTRILIRFIAMLSIVDSFALPEIRQVLFAPVAVLADGSGMCRMSHLLISSSAI